MPMQPVPPKPAPKKPAPNVCVSCKEPESPARPGGRFKAQGDNGMVLAFWMCDRCAIPLGPGQGPIDLDDPTTRV